MNNIDFSKYPKIMTYVQDFINKDFFKPYSYNPLDEETFISIIDSWINKFEQELPTLIKNTKLIYELTNEETGYQALAKDWKDLKETWGIKNRISEELIRCWWVEKFSRCISQFYTLLYTKDNYQYRGGLSGCFISCSWSCQFLESDYKKVKYNVVTTINFSLQIQSSQHLETDLH